MKREILIAAGGLTVLVWLAATGYGQPKEAIKTFMRAKLTHSQRVLEGLVEEDYDKIAKNSQEMSLLSLAETWQVLTTPEYLDYSRKFRNAVDSLNDMARKKNLDQATLAYNQVTTRCVECHKYVRAVRLATNQKEN